MPESTPVYPDDSHNENETAGAAPQGSSPFGKLAILLMVGMVVVLECAVAYFLIPSRGETAVMAGIEMPSNEPSAATAEEPPEEQPETPTQVEVDLGEFAVTSYQPVTNTTLRIDFHLYGTVGVENEKDLLARLERNNHRFRDEVIVTVRSSEITDLTDAGLGLIKRKILEKSNALLGKQYLKSIIFSDFSFIEQ